MSAFIVGITGPTGSGKSFVADIFKSYGFAVIDADKIARGIMEKGSPVLAKIASEFGSDMLNVDGSLNRQKLADIAFADEQKTRALNGITHPAILDRFSRLAQDYEKDGYKYIILDAPLLFESGADGMCEATISVISPRGVRLKRILSRDGISAQQAEIRMSAQHDDEYYEKKSDFCIYADDNFDNIKSKVKKIIDIIRHGGKDMSEKTQAELLKEKLFFNNKNSYCEISDGQSDKAYEFCEGYKSFLDKAKTEREAVGTIISMAEQKGFAEFVPMTQYKPGDRVYFNNRNKAVILAVIGKRSVSEGVRICAAHIDSPRLDLKPNPLYEDNEFALFKTHYYGGIKKYQWTAMPLSLHGRVVKRDGSYIDISIGEQDDEPVFCVTDLLPHLAAEQMKRSLAQAIKGEELNILIGSRPFKDDKSSELVKLNILKILFEKYGIIEEDFLSAELECVPAFKARDVGFDRSMIGAYGHDDRVCAYPAVMAALDCDTPEYTAISVLTDKEETGSDGNTGLNSAYLKYFISDLAHAQSARLYEVLSRSQCLSADVNAGFDPNFPDVAERRNVAYLNHGVVVTKYTGSRGKSGTSDAGAEFVGTVRRLLDESDVKWQIGELGKVDAGGGGTVAMYIANMNIDVIDLGVPVLSMHSPFEVVSKLDVYMAYKAFMAFYK